jgi:hypothetical protein
MKMHDTDGLSLAFGLVFLGIAGLWVASRLVTLGLAGIGWLAAGALVVVGLAGIIHTVTANRRHADDPRR